MTSAAAPGLDLRRTLGAVEVHRDVVRATGPDAVGYLQGQLSQNVEELAVGATTWSFVLQPTGKVDVWCRVTRTDGDTYLLDTDGGAGELLVARLRRFLLRTKAEIEPLAGWRCIALRGPGAEETGRTRADEVRAELRVPAGWPGADGSHGIHGTHGVDLLGPDVAVPGGIVRASVDDYQALRIRSGVPAMGAELTDRTIPAEAGQWVIDASVDFGKGCFTGQELVARIDSRGGNVPRHLRGLVIDGATGPPPGATVEVDGHEVGTVTSSAGTVALAYVARAVEPPSEAVVSWGDDKAPATIESLPLG